MNSSHPLKLSAFRLSSVALALAAALALPPVFAQSAPTATPADAAAGAQAPPATTQDTAPAPQTAAAPSPTDSKPVSFKDLDVNKDGKLSKEEVASDPAWTADFDAADADKDGYLSKGEFKKHLAEIRKTAKLNGSQG